MKWRVPYKFWRFHASGCSTQYRGCTPDCPKRIYEEIGKCTGPSRFSVFWTALKKAFREL